MTVKGNSTLSFIRRNILTNSEAFKNLAYKQLVRSVLEYASAAWGLASNTAVSRLGAVQRKATRLICGISLTDRKTSTTGLLQELDFKSLSEHQSDRRLKVFSQYHHFSKTAISNYV